MLKLLLVGLIAAAALVILYLTASALWRTLARFARSYLLYRGQRVVVCQRPFGEIHWDDYKPALLRPEDRRTFGWRDLAPESLPEVLETHLPVCWNCHVAAAFRREHPEMVTDRDSKSAAHA